MSIFKINSLNTMHGRPGYFSIAGYLYMQSILRYRKNTEICRNQNKKMGGQLRTCTGISSMAGPPRRVGIPVLGLEQQV